MVKHTRGCEEQWSFVLAVLGALAGAQGGCRCQFLCVSKGSPSRALGWIVGQWGGSWGGSWGPALVYGVIIHSCHLLELLSSCMRDLGSQQGPETAIKQRYGA